MRHRAPSKFTMGRVARHRAWAGIPIRLISAVALAALGLVMPSSPVTAAPPVCDAGAFAAEFNAAPDGSTTALCGDLTIVASDNLPLVVATGKVVTLDLAGYTLNVTGPNDHAGIQASDGSALTITDSSAPSTGKLVATGGDDGAGIGGVEVPNATGGDITIDGGTVVANGGDGAAGIGGGFSGGAGTITINGGTVTATGHASCNHNGFDDCAGAGIGGGYNGKSGVITINGGTVVATGQGVSAGIGGGGASGGSNDGKILITGGDVTAVGGNDLLFSGAGIGSAGGRTAGPVTITGGTVHATGGGGTEAGSAGAGIGTGAAGGGPNEPITISGGEVTATGGATAGGAGGSAGIGGGGCSVGATVTITGTSTTVTAVGKEGGAGIGGGGCSVNETLGIGGALTVGTGASVKVSSGGGNAIGNGADSTGFGSFANSGVVTVATPLTIPAGTTVTNDGTITLEDTLANSGTINGVGTLGGTATIDNAGAIWHTIVVGSGLTVHDHHYQLLFDPNGGEADWGADQTPFAFVDGPTLAEVGRTIGDLPTAHRPGYDLTGWFDNANGTGNPITDTTTLSTQSSTGGPVLVVLHAGWTQHAPVSLYAYPHGAATQPSSCSKVTDLADACTLGQALGLANTGDTVILEADPGTGSAATFTTGTGWTVPHESLTIKPDAGVSATLDGQRVAPYLLSFTGTGTLTVIGLRIVNSVGAPDVLGPGGGGIVNRGGDLRVSDSVFDGNTATATSQSGVIGGGIVNLPSTDGLRPNGPVTVSDSTFTANTTTGSAGASLAFGGGLISLGNVTGGIVVSGSTFAGNDATGGGVLTVGGGIVTTNLQLATEGSISVSTSTFAGNRTIGSNVVGGAIVNSSRAWVVATTFSGNSVSGDSPQYGGAIVSTGPVTIAGSLIAGGGVACRAAPSGVVAGSFIDAGFNISDDATCGFTDSTSVNDAAHLAELLDALGDNGGPTNTVAPKPGSPAVGMIPAGSVATVDGAQKNLCPTTDQRGVASPAGTACNAGSVQTVVGAPLAVTSRTLPDGVAGTDYGTAALAAVGGTEPYTWSLTVGALPDGLQLSADGKITGTPTKAGTFTFAVQVMDKTELVASQTLSIVVEPVEPELVVVTQELPDGTVGAGYRQALTATGAADGVYHWTVTVGSLPPGLTLSDDGVISGTPSAAGTFAFTVSVNDPAIAELSIVVKPAAATSGSPSTTQPSKTTSSPTTTLPSTTPPPVTGSTTPPAGTGLPATGVSGMLLPLGIGGLVLLVAGGLALVIAARRRRTDR